MARDRKGRPAASMAVGLGLLVAGISGIVLSAGDSVGVIGGVVTVLAGLTFLGRGVSMRKKTRPGRRGFFMS
ncbi:hypothetical protein [Kibdelosporangium phytohabitans]|uniref:Uncharacterized protein n=1 Tax=Kibdelosporangium phytohabitans TaxID=860235 RepID=A0A0N9I3G3_9PSEU|nr:hypothetical protein [Kibdelosporangium phytohabitans]ALG10589.1 hypothetical protein AOZ06_30125 [Kibdelosporangium phytohabitans]MBE1461696.1 cytochrome c biogenesis protein CcdA [Kibdelosporangium phytohabitans]